MQAPPLPAGVLHPAWIVLGALRGMGITLDELIELAGATPDDGVVFGETDYEQHDLLRSDTPYAVRGAVTSVTRREGKRAGAFDVVVARADDRGRRPARRWRSRGSRSSSSASGARRDGRRRGRPDPGAALRRLGERA